MTESQEYRLGLIGWPLDHSISPAIQNAALAAAGFAGSYCLYPLRPLPGGDAQLRALLNQMRSGYLHGLNVTIPHKQTIIPYLDELTATAWAVGAVNIIFKQEEYLIGDNSDAPAFRQDLYRLLSESAEKQPLHIPDQDNSRQVETNGSPATALVLGAGGAARAVVYALLQEGWQIIVAARKLAAARQLCEELGRQTTSRSQRIVPLLLSRESLSAVAFCHLIVNATPVGAISGEESSPWPLDLPLPVGAVTYDLVYNPRETPLVRYAKNAGLAAETGMGMLVEQAALAFERWMSVPAPRSVMHAAARKALSLD